MIIKTLVDRELTPEELRSIKQFRSYTDGVSFACLRERVMVMTEVDSPTDVEMIKEAALDQMDTALCTHPDFTTFNMNDGHTLLVMPSGLAAFSQAPCYGQSMTVNMMLRGECLDAAENMEIIAVAYEEEEE